MNRQSMFLLVFVILMLPRPLIAPEKTLTIIHSNDMHSHFLAASPNIDYSPLTTGEDKTIGGWARIAAAIKEVKKERSNPVLVVDAGDLLMGSLFHMLTREQAFEFRLLSRMGYDAVTLGNHEFDLKPGGLARILTSARNSGQIPAVVFSNAVFSRDSSKDDALESIFKQGIVKPYLVLERGRLRIGLFGLLGKDAAEVSPFASPVSFEDPIATAQKMVKILRESEKVDMVICLFRSGLSENKKRSEDKILFESHRGLYLAHSGHRSQGPQRRSGRRSENDALGCG